MASYLRERCLEEKLQIENDYYDEEIKNEENNYLKKNYSKEELKTEQDICLSLFNIPHPNEIRMLVDFYKIINRIKCIKLLFFTINTIAGNIIIEGFFNEDFLDKFNALIKDNRFVLVYKENKYDSWIQILNIVDINDDDHYYLTLVQQGNIRFDNFYCIQSNSYRLDYIIFYYKRKYNIKLIIFEKSSKIINFSRIFYPIVMLPEFLCGSIYEDDDKLYLDI
jgi:hypothetical protein